MKSPRSAASLTALYVVCFPPELADPEERTVRLREVVSALPQSVQLVMRYLFAFLSQ